MCVYVCDNVWVVCFDLVRSLCLLNISIFGKWANVCRQSLGAITLHRSFAMQFTLWRFKSWFEK